MPKATYDYVSRGAPVIMRERWNGWPVAEYLAWPDKSGYLWKLYPYKRHAYLKDIPFTKKTIRASEARAIENPTVKPQEKKQDTKPQERVLTEPEQIKLI